MKTYDVVLLFTLCIFSTCNFMRCSFGLKEYYLEDLCDDQDTANLDIRYIGSGILQSHFSQAINCSLKLSPKEGYSVVLSISKYYVYQNDILTITDSDDIMMVLRGKRDLYDEEKSFTSNGPMTIHLATNSTFSYYRDTRFKFVFTQVHGGKCHHGEFQCRNLNCIPHSLTCDSHNHCGDNSDQAEEVCNSSPTEEIFTNPPLIIPENRIRILPIILIAGVALILAIVIPLIVYGVKRMKNTANPQTAIPGTTSQPPMAPAPQIPTASISDLPTVLVMQNPTAPAQVYAAPSVFARIRQSFRRSKPSSQPPTSPDAREKDNYQVPSMYPQIPDISSQEGIENPEFKIEE